MKPILDTLLIVFFMFGHLATWTRLFNRLHALPLRRGTLHALDRVICLFVLIVPCLYVWQFRTCETFLRQWHQTFTKPQDFSSVSFFFWIAYGMLCLITAVSVLAVWAFRKTTNRLPPGVRINTKFTRHLTDECDGPLTNDMVTQRFSRIPGNQIFQVDITYKQFSFKRLPSKLTGLKIAHLSDLHMTGRISPDFYEEIIASTNAECPDIIVVTGDIVDKLACLEWLPSTLGELRATFGVFYVLGNHDTRVDEKQLRSILNHAGLIDLGGKTHRMTIHDVQILFAGNEQPWFHSSPSFPEAVRSSQESFRILLSHTPDQIRWAQRHQFDLMLAGHTHGGQIRPPLLGPIISPSIYGTKYASGVFHEPPTLLHVSRGVCGVEPLRLWCRPEIAIIELMHAR